MESMLRQMPWHAGRMQWHWGNIGSAAAGIVALLAALAAVYGAVRYGPAWLRESRERQRAQAAAVRAQEALSHEARSCAGRAGLRRGGGRARTADKGTSRPQDRVAR
jgi:hypothetical protein